MPGKISTHEPVTQLRNIRVRECGEPLVDYSGHPRIFESTPIWGYERESLLRKGAAERLWKAAEALPKGYALSVIEGWRPPHIQRRMYQASWNRWREVYPQYSDSALRRVVNRFTAPPNRRVPPPHTTGGAVDLVLANADGELLDMTAPFRRFQGKAYPFDAPGLSEETLKNRGILKKAMEGAGITNYPSEFWHWTFGDQGWAYRGGHEFAIYGQVEPPGYSAGAEEGENSPLVWVAGERPT